MIMRRNPIILAFNIVCLLPKINRKTLEFKLAELPMGGRDAPLFGMNWIIVESTPKLSTLYIDYL